MTAEERRIYMRFVRSTPRIVIEKTDAELFEKLTGNSTKTENGCWEFNGHRDTLGYGKTCVRAKHVLAHRAAYALKVGPIPAGMLVCHSCDNPPCINPAHLFLGSNYDNTMDAVRKGRKFIPDSRGEKQWFSKLKNHEVLEIRRLCANRTKPQSQIALQFGVKQSAISSIHTRETWKHL